MILNISMTQMSIMTIMIKRHQCMQFTSSYNKVYSNVHDVMYHYF